MVLADAGIDTGIDLDALLDTGPLLAGLVGHRLPGRSRLQEQLATDATRRGVVDASRRRLADHRPRALRHGARVRRLRRPDPLVDRRPRRLLAGVDGRSPACVGRPPPAAIRDGDTMPGRALVPRRHAQLRRAGSGTREVNRPDDIAVVAISQTRDAHRADVGPPHARRAAVRRGAAPARRPSRRSCRRLRPEHPRDARRPPRHRLDRCDLVELCARVRRALGDRPLRPDRARRARRPSTATATAPRTSTARDHVADIVAALPTPAPRRPHPVPRPAADLLRRRPRAVEHHVWDELLLGAPAEPLTFTPVAADHPLYVLFSSGHDGTAQGDRPRPRWRRRRAPQGADVPPGPDARRSLLLVHDDRVDDVELPRVRPAHRLDDRAVRRRPASPGLEHAVEGRRRHRHDGVRVVGAVPDGVPQGRRPTRQRGALWVGSTGAPLPADGFRWVSEVVGVPVNSICGGTDICHGVRRRLPAAAGSRRRDRRSPARLRRRGVHPRRATCARQASPVSS